jgi:hypothetical protein
LFSENYPIELKLRRAEDIDVGYFAIEKNRVRIFWQFKISIQPVKTHEFVLRSQIFFFIINLQPQLNICTVAYYLLRLPATKDKTFLVGPGPMIVLAAMVGPASPRTAG